METWSEFKFRVKWHSRVGSLARGAIRRAGLVLVSWSRKLLRWSGGVCWYCAANCGFDSVVSRYGFLCSRCHERMATGLIGSPIKDPGEGE